MNGTVQPALVQYIHPKAVGRKVMLWGQRSFWLCEGERMFPPLKDTFRVRNNSAANHTWIMQVELKMQKKPVLRLLFDSTGTFYQQDIAINPWQTCPQKNAITLELNTATRFYTAASTGQSIQQFGFRTSPDVERIVSEPRCAPISNADTPTDQDYDLPGAGARALKQAINPLLKTTNYNDETGRGQCKKSFTGNKKGCRSWLNKFQNISFFCAGAQTLPATHAQTKPLYSDTILSGLCWLLQQMEDENIRQAIPNEASWSWMHRIFHSLNAHSRFEESFTIVGGLCVNTLKHRKGFVFTEFLVQRSYADKYNLISSGLATTLRKPVAAR